MLNTLSLSLAALAAQPVDAPDWKALATSDIEFAYQTYVDNHPGWLDPTNPGFRDELNAARAAGLAIAETADSSGDYGEALMAFSAVLSDGHARLRSRAKATTGMTGGKATLLWPGFVAAGRGGEARLTDVSGIDLPRGTRIVACDDQPVERFIAKQGIPLGMRPKAPGHWYVYTPNVFAQMDTIPPIARSCDFIAPDGTTHTKALDWQPAPEGLYPRMLRSSEGDPMTVGLTMPAPGIAWIALPTFAPEDEDAARYDTLFADLAARHDELADARAVVIDLRGNDGGSSSWSRRVAGLLWGEDAVKRRMADYFARTEVWYRASEGNLHYLEDAKTQYADYPDIVDFVTELSGLMESARAAGEPFYVERDDEADEAADRALSPLTDFDTPVYVIVHGSCASACLDALDTFTRFSNTTLVGAPSSSDTTYMEVRKVDMPSGQGEVVIPIKFWKDRPRGSGEAYQPALRMDGLDFTTEAFLALIEEQLD